jgi:hypothetical protein
MDVAQLKVLETNIDDLNPESYEYVMDRLFDAGALDVFLAPIQMKKNRPATLFRVLCKPGDVETMTDILFRETSTLGIREETVERHALPRTIEHVSTPTDRFTSRSPSYETAQPRARRSTPTAGGWQPRIRSHFARSIRPHRRSRVAGLADSRRPGSHASAAGMMALSG